VDPKGIIEVPTGIESSWINKTVKRSDSKRKFIFIGRNERRKGLPELHAIIKQKFKGSNFTFDLVGPIPERERIDLSGVRYHGMLKDEERMKELLRGADVLICPSHSEGMPNVIMEAMASGNAIIATDVGAVSCMVDEKNGWLVQAGDKPAIEKALMAAIKLSDASLDGMKRNSIAKVEQLFIWDKLIKELIEKIDKKILS
jgi:glycosyltransferase involved in cell wall biosynthesis